MKVLWTSTTTNGIEQLKNGVNYFEVERSVYDYMQKNDFAWIALTTMKGKCTSRKKDYIYMKIIGIEESLEGDRYFVKLNRGVCGECEHFKDLDCVHPGSTLCGCFMFFLPGGIKGN